MQAIRKPHEGMMNSIDTAFAFQEKALSLRGYRQQLLAGNIANADTPNYKAMDIDFAKALRQAASGSLALERTSGMHMAGGQGNTLAGIQPQYRSAVQPSIDGNTVDSNIEQGQFSENALHYMATLQFLNLNIQSALQALKG